MSETNLPVIERPTLDDAEAVGALYRMYHREADEFLPIDSEVGELIDHEKESHDYLARRLERAGRDCFVARIGNKVVGFISAERGNDHVEAFIDLLIVDEKYRGQGIGDRLLAGFECTVPLDRPIALDALSPYMPLAVKFYEDHGYKLQPETDDKFMIKV